MCLLKSFPIFFVFYLRPSFTQNVIEINRPPLPVYQSVIEKTRGLAFRTQAIGAAMEKAAVEKPAQATETQPQVVEGAR